MPDSVFDNAPLLDRVYRAKAAEGESKHRRDNTADQSMSCHRAGLIVLQFDDDGVMITSTQPTYGTPTHRLLGVAQIKLRRHVGHDATLANRVSQEIYLRQ